MTSVQARLAFPATILLVGINLRPTIAAIGPLLDGIQRDTGLSDSGASLLTALPVALMGICLLGTGRLQQAIGRHRGVAVGLVFIGLACLARWVSHGMGTLLATAILGGVGIAMVQALMPAIIREQAGNRSAGLMGLYSTAIMGGAMVSAAASPWIGNLGGWSVALGIWALPVVAGLSAWLMRGHVSRTGNASDGFGIYRKARAWLLLAFFGFGTGAYTLVLAWLPPFYTQLGWPATVAGAMLGALTFAEVIAGIAVSVWIDRFPDRRPALFLAIAALLAGLACLCLAPLALAWPAAILAGLGIGALFPLSLIIAMDHGTNAAEAGAIAGFVQGGGYLLAALLPLVAGLLRQELSDLTPAWLLMAGLCVVLAGMARRFRPGDRIALSA
ncbi:MFS transporter [Bradyrhizobium sp. NAS80.1]|uniref:MFS transporter n=1 Tax=Bradyrhizobium sp. NAS80.1 TaxID=1680159 RepID=UPI00096089FE|nr:MFS transporter [Bradyrhizobium sp. NAS80.1]OKO87384.1 MFS transporter [Bradyrhizobium sp. NAS80.1]